MFLIQKIILPRPFHSSRQKKKNKERETPKICPIFISVPTPYAPGEFRLTSQKTILVRVGNVEPSGGQGHGSLVDAPSSPQVVDALDALLARDGGEGGAVGGQAAAAEVGHVVGALGAAAAPRAVGLAAGGVVADALAGQLQLLLLAQAARPLGRVAGATAAHGALGPRRRRAQAARGAVAQAAAAAGGAA